MDENKLGQTYHKVIEFKIDKKNAALSLRKWASQQNYAQFEFEHIAKINLVDAVYVPYWFRKVQINFDIVATTDTLQERGQRSDDDFKVVSLKEFHTKSGSIYMEDICVPAADFFDPDYLYGIEPFAYSEAVDFKDDHVREASVYSVSKNLDQARPELDEIMEDSALRVIKKEFKTSRPHTGNRLGDTTDKMTLYKYDNNYKIISEELVLVPIYIIEAYYQGLT